jgi:hypothetical protein
MRASLVSLKRVYLVSARSRVQFPPREGFYPEGVMLVLSERLAFSYPVFLLFLISVRQDLGSYSSLYQTS